MTEKKSKWKVRQEAKWNSRRAQREKAGEYKLRYAPGILRIPCGGGYRIIRSRPLDQ